MANLTPQAKRLIILGLVGIVLVGGGVVVNTYLLAPPPPPPAAPIRPVLPPPPRPPGASPAPAPQAAPAPAPRPPAAVPSPGLGTPPAPAAPEASPKPTMAAAAPGSYGLQVGAFAVKANAERLQKRLEEKGYAVTVRQASPRVPRHRVLVGTYTAKADAEAQREKVVEAGAKGAKVVPAAGGKLTVEAGTFRSLDAAIDLARELQKSGLAPRIDSRPTTTGLFQVRVGAYANRQDAQAQVDALRKEGLSPIVVRN